jgi:amino acid transporter
MVGFESAITLGGESKAALKNIPRATLTGLLPAAIPFILMAYVLVAAFRGSPVSLDHAEAPFDRLAAVCGLPAFGHLIDLGVLLSFFACTLGTLNAAARVLYAMSQQRHFWPPAGVAHPRNGTPHRALVIVSLLAFAVPAALMASGMSLDAGIDTTAELGSFGFFLSYVLICVAAPVYLRRRGELRARHVAYAAGGVAVLLIPLLSFFYPVSPAPARYFPAIFVVFVVAGTLASLAHARRRAAA